MWGPGVAVGVLVVGWDVRVQRHCGHDWKLGQPGNKLELTQVHVTVSVNTSSAPGPG